MMPYTVVLTPWVTDVLIYIPNLPIVLSYPIGGRERCHLSNTIPSTGIPWYKVGHTEMAVFLGVCIKWYVYYYKIFIRNNLRKLFILAIYNPL